MKKLPKLILGGYCRNKHLLTPTNTSISIEGYLSCNTCRKSLYIPHPLPTPLERFWKYVTKTETCWLWTGSLSHNGYPQFRVGNSMLRGTRFIYEHFKGSISNDLDIDHLCNVRHCVNPDHLEAVTRRINIRRMFKRQKQNLQLNQNKGAN